MLTVYLLGAWFHLACDLTLRRWPVEPRRIGAAAALAVAWPLLAGIGIGSLWPPPGRKPNDDLAELYFLAWVEP